MTPIRVRRDETTLFVPCLTFGLLALLTVIFVMEQRDPMSGGAGHPPSLGTLIAFGALRRDLVQQGQAFRILTAPFLHVSWGHLIGNGIALLLSGWALEKLVGGAWFVCIFGLGAMAGSMGSLLFTDPTLVSVGASGGIMALIGALLFTSVRLSSGQLRVQFRMLRLAVPSLFPIFAAHGATRVDYGAHVGGFLLGALLGALLVGTWDREEDRPGSRSAATAMASLACVAFAGSAALAARQHAVYGARAALIPDSRLPHGTAAMAALGDGLLSVYPRDPRAHAYAALARLKSGNRLDAERELRLALPLAASNEDRLGTTLTVTIRGLLAQTVHEDGDDAAALVIARDACVIQPPPPIVQLLTREGLCAGK